MNYNNNVGKLIAYAEVKKGKLDIWQTTYRMSPLERNKRKQGG